MAVYTCGGTSAGNKLCTVEIANSHAPCPNQIETWTGCVLRLRERNGYHDSDFYALVWDESAGRTREVEYASTRGWTYHNHAVIDATPEIVTKADAYRSRVREEARVELARLDAEYQATIVEIGKEVRSLATRGKHKGIVGLVRNIVDGQYGTQVVVEVIGENSYRYLPYDRVEVIVPAESK